MSKLKKEDLLFGLDSWHLAWTENYKERTGKEPSESTKQAYQQIKEMIQKPGCSHVRKIYRKIGSDGLDAACNEIGVEYLYCQDCGEYFDYITLKQVMIPRPKITEECYDEKAKMMIDIIQMFALESQGRLEGKSDIFKVTEDFLCSFAEEIQCEK